MSVRVHFIMPSCLHFRVVCLLSFVVASAQAQTVQTDTLTGRPAPSTRNVPMSEQKDVLDVARRLLPRLHLKEPDTVLLPVGRTFIWVLPELGYSLQTRLLVQLQGNIAYRRAGANVSTIIPTVAYTQNNQLLLATKLNSWTRDNQLNWVGDYRLYHYPQATYGLGTTALPGDELRIDFTYLRIYQSLLKRVGHNLYAGLGYNLDYHWNIRTMTDENAPASIANYQEGVQGRSVSSGIAFNLLYDGRMNSINPEPAFYANLIVRPNFRVLGSDKNYQILSLDMRKYLYFPARSANILALWTYNSFTLGDAAPYLDLPSTGGDTYENSGRGYIQGRFRGRNFLYQEVEYRFPLTHNRLLGGVVFANNQVASEAQTNQFTKMAPAVGAGLRVTTNKYTRLNWAVDYAVGLNGSKGIFFNFGEFF